MIAQTVCIRCGKPRVQSKSWSEKIGISKVSFTQNVCPDKVCQKQVDEILRKRTEVYTTRIADSLRRRTENKNKSILLRKAGLVAKDALKMSKKLIFKHAAL